MQRILGGRAPAAVALALTFLAGGVALAQEGTAPAPAPMEGATITDAGWWNRLRPQLDLPIGQPAAPPVPGVPEGSLVVAASVGEPDAITAVGIETEALPGATVETFELTLRQVTDDGANLNEPVAALVACPITGFWVGGENGVWETRPDYDCGLAEAAGARADDGTWTFDLRAIGQLWSDGTLDANGVALVEDVEPPAAFRTAFAGLASLGIGVRFVASGGAEPEDPFGGGDTGGGFDTGGGSIAPGLGGLGGTPLRPPPVPAGPTVTAPPPTTAPAVDEVAVDLPSTPVSDGPGSPLGTLPWWAWPLAVLALAAGLAAMVGLGPAGEPVVAATGRGVTRALEARISPEETR